MAESGVKEIVLGDDFGDVVIATNTGKILIRAIGRVESYPKAANDEVPANDKARAGPEIGDEMADGTIYAGISPDTHKPMCATPQDAPGTFTFNEAAKFAKNLDANGYKDWHPPTKGELNVLYENRNKGKLAGTFNVTGSHSRRVVLVVLARQRRLCVDAALQRRAPGQQPQEQRLVPALCPLTDKQKERP